MDVAAVLEKLRELRRVLLDQLDSTAPAGTLAMHYCPGQVPHPLMHWHKVACLYYYFHPAEQGQLPLQVAHAADMKHSIELTA